MQRDGVINVNPYEGFDEETRNGFLPKTSRITATLLGGRNYKKNLKIGLSQVGKMYIVCSILRNALTCLYSNTTADFFGLDPLSLNDYFN